MFKSVNAQNAACNAVTRLVDLGSTYPSGLLNIYEIDSSVVLQLSLPLPAFKDATDGTAVSNFIPSVVASVDATARSFAVLNRDATAIFTGTVSDMTGSGDLKLNSVIIPKDSTVMITDIIYIVPPEFTYIGPPGETGIKGTTGILGMTGASGVTGLIGSTGILGETGIQGLIGETGVQGLTGDTGIQGQTGILGETGIQGIQGATGSSASGILTFNSTAFTGAVATGIMGQTILSNNMTFTSYTLLADATSSITLDVQKSSYASYPNTSSMHGSTGIFLASAIKNQNTNLDWWSGTTGANGEVLRIIVTESDATASRISLNLEYTVF